jgi:hypothetical protein
MMFHVRGIDRGTGRSVQPIIVEADSENEALAEAARRGMFTVAIEPYAPPPTPTVRSPHAAPARSILVRCPACKKKFSETADACPKCGFKVDPATMASLRVKAIRETRIGLLVAAVLLLVVSTPCLLGGFFTNTEGGYQSPGASRQREAYERFQRGERLSDQDVDDLANREVYVSSQEKKEGARTVMMGSLVFFLPGVGILVYLLVTRDRASNAS